MLVDLGLALGLALLVTAIFLLVVRLLDARALVAVLRG